MVKTSTKLILFFILTLVCITSSHAQIRGMQQVIHDPETGQSIQPYENSWAIIIGIDRYQHVTGLDYAVADARAIERMLTNSFGFEPDNITVLTNEQATQINIRRAFSSLYRVGVDDRVLIFFAGHGETIDLPAGGNMGFLIPYEGRAGSPEELYQTSMSMQTIRELEGIIPAKHVLFLIDACYGGLAAYGVRSLPRETQGYIRKITTDRARQIITAGGRGEQVVERPEWGHSAFTYTLLNGLEKGLADLDNDGIITAYELSTYLRRQVARLTNNRQTPQFRAFTHDEGEFLFILPRVIEPVVPPTPVARYGDVFITSNPAGAEILINGEPIQQTTPAEIRRVAEGDHTIELRRGNLYASSTISVEPDRINRIRLNLETARGGLHITSSPFEAEVYIDGEYKGSTPVLLSDLYAGRYDLTLQKSGYLPYTERVEVRAFDRETVEAKLLLPASININSTPAGARVYLDGELKGESPVTIADLYPGEYTLSMIKDEYEEWRENVHIREGQRQNLRANLTSKFGLLTVSSRPSDARIVLNGREIAHGSLESHKLPVGTHRVIIEREDYQRYQRDIKINPGREEKLSVELVSAVGFLTINASPRNASIYVDNERIGVGSVHAYKVPIGAREIEIRHGSTRRPARQIVRVDPELERAIDIQMGVFTTASLLRSAVLPGWGQVYDRSNTKGTLFMIGAAAAGGFFYFAHTGYADKIDEYNALQKSYLNASSDQEADLLWNDIVDKSSKVNDAYSMRSIALYAAAGLYALNLIDALIFHSRGSAIELYAGANTDIKMQPRLTYNSYGISAGLQITF